jgi:D-alanine-D-alanine ligase
MKKLGVIFGGRTVEHDVSIVTGLQLLENVDRSKYEAFPIYIARGGEWFVGDKLKEIAFYRRFDPNDKSLTRVILSPVPGVGGLYANDKGLFSKGPKVIPIDVAVLAMHGMHGEDGTLQGLMELANIPYTSAGVTGSAVGMDKIVMKDAFRGMGLPVVKCVYFTRAQWREQQDAMLENAEALGYPLIVKPANLGSSIGIKIARDREGLMAAIEVAQHFDRRVIVERVVENMIEINCACIGYGGETTVSLCEQPVNASDILDFGKKYMPEDGASKGMQTLTRRIPAPITDELTSRIQAMTAFVFKALECKGVVRIDYMYDTKSEQLYINEINTIPGSFAFYLFEPMGLKYPQLIDKLVEYAYKAHADKNASEYAFKSELLEKAGVGGGKTGKLPSKRG